jgi:hypothetical protein
LKPNSTYNSTFFAFLFVCLIVNSAAAQSAYMLLNREYLLPIENAANSSTAELHTNCKPFISAEFKDLTDSFFVPKNKLIRHVFLSGSQNSGDTKLDIAIAPLITTLPGYDFTERKSMLETRLGAKLNLNFKRKLAIELQAVNNNSDFADYWNNYSQQNKVIPLIHPIHTLILHWEEEKTFLVMVTVPCCYQTLLPIMITSKLPQQFGKLNTSTFSQGSRILEILMEKRIDL